MAIPTTWQIGAKVTPAQAALNYTAGASAKGTKWATNYLQSKVDPFKAASDAAAYWLSQVNMAGTAGFQAGLARVNRNNVAALVSVQGPTLYSAGITNKGTPNYTTAATGLIPAIQQAAANLQPRGSVAQNQQRMIDMNNALRAMRGLYRSK